MKKSLLVVTVVAILAGSVAFFVARQPANAEPGMVELRVSNLSCGSCADKIKGALGGIAGVQSVEVNVTSGRGQVVYDPVQIAAPQIAQAVTDSGYPANVLRVLNSDQFKNILSEDARLSEEYVAKVGEILVARDDFEQFVTLQLAAAGLENQVGAREQILGQAWDNLLQQTLMLMDAERNQVVVQDGEVDMQISQLREQIADFDKNIQTRFGSLEVFAIKVKEDMTISRNIEQFVLVGIKDSEQRQGILTNWYRNLVDNTPVLFYDAGLKQAANSSGGCGSRGCCSKS